MDMFKAGKRYVVKESFAKDRDPYILEISKNGQMATIVYSGDYAYKVGKIEPIHNYNASAFEECKSLRNHLPIWW